jgi:hypothetical protein
VLPFMQQFSDENVFKQLIRQLRVKTERISCEDENIFRDAIIKIIFREPDIPSNEIYDFFRLFAFHSVISF